MCSTSVAAFPTDEFALLQFESWSTALFISLRLSELYSSYDAVCEEEASTSVLLRSFMRSAQIAWSVEAALVHPVVRQSEAHCGGWNGGLHRM